MSDLRTRGGPFASAYLLLGLAFFSLAGCASVDSKRRTVAFPQRGTASWYGIDFHGRPTASGEIYDMFGVSAAHRTLPLGTILSVTNLENGRKISVKVNDRGPFVGDRILDLSFGAAHRLGMTEKGLAKVKIVPIGKAAVPRGARKGFTIQIGSFAERQNAQALVRQLSARYPSVRIEPFRTNSGVLHRVRVGRFSEESQAEKTAKRIGRELGSPALILGLDG